MKRHWFRAVKRDCKASKIHSSGDVCPGHKKGKVRKTDGQISEFFNSNLIKVFIGSRSLVNTVLSSGYKVFGAFFIHRRVIVLVWRLLAAAVYLVKAAAAVARWTRKILAGKPCGA